MLTAISPLMAQSGRARIRVIDATGAVVPGAEASIIGKDGKPSATAHANSEGEIAFSDLPIGDSVLEVTCSGFSNFFHSVTISGDDEVKFDAKLQVGTVGTIVEVSGRSDPYHRANPRQQQLEFPPDSAPKKPRRRWWPFR